MDYLTVVTVVGKTFLLSTDKGKLKLVRQERMATTTGTTLPPNEHKNKQLYLTLASPSVK
jgi:uncharacterized membrane protein